MTVIPSDVNLSNGYGSFTGQPGDVNPLGESEVDHLHLAQYHLSMNGGIYLKPGADKIANHSLLATQGNFTNQSNLVIKTSGFDVFGTLSGCGCIEAQSNSTLEINQADAGNTITLHSSNLYIIDAMEFHAPLKFDSASDITIESVFATSWTFSRATGEADFYHGTTLVSQLTIAKAPPRLYAMTNGGAVLLQATPSSTNILPMGNGH